MFDNKESFGNLGFLPHAICLYGVFCEETLLYIGTAAGLRRRFKNHHKLSEFEKLGATSIRWNEYTNEQAEQLAKDEQKYIELLKPPLNSASSLRKTKRPSKLEDRTGERILNQIPKSKLHQKTFDLLWNRINSSLSKTQTLDVISEQTGLTYSWLDYFARDIKPSPSVDKVEHLYNFLNGKELGVE